MELTKKLERLKRELAFVTAVSEAVSATNKDGIPDGWRVDIVQGDGIVLLYPPGIGRNGESRYGVPQDEIEGVVNALFAGLRAYESEWKVEYEMRMAALELIRQTSDEMAPGPVKMWVEDGRVLVEAKSLTGALHHFDAYTESVSNKADFARVHWKEGPGNPSLVAGWEVTAASDAVKYAKWLMTFCRENDGGNTWRTKE